MSGFFEMCYDSLHITDTLYACTVRRLVSGSTMAEISYETLIVPRYSLKSR